AAEHLLVLVLHHIVADGWSLALLVDELTVIYEALAAGKPSPLPEPPLQDADYARRQRGWLVGEALGRQAAFLRPARPGGPGRVGLPAARPRPAVQSFRGARLLVPVSPGLAAELRRGARRHGATLFMILLAALDALLHRVAGQDEVVIGSPIANRERLEL